MRFYLRNPELGRKLDGDWFAKFKLGDGRTMQNVFDKHSRGVCLFAFGILQNEEDAEDAVIECFGKLWEARKQFETPEHLIRWLYVVVRNCSLSMLRDRSKASAALAGWRHIESGVTKAVEFEFEWAKTDVFTGVQRKVDGLGKRGRDAIYKHLLDGLTDVEIAKLLNTTVENVQVVRCRALARVRRELKNDTLFFLLLWFTIELSHA